MIASMLLWQSSDPMEMQQIRDFILMVALALGVSSLVLFAINLVIFFQTQNDTNKMFMIGGAAVSGSAFLVVLLLLHVDAFISEEDSRRRDASAPAAAHTIHVQPRQPEIGVPVAVGVPVPSIQPDNTIIVINNPTYVAEVNPVHVAETVVS